MIGGNTLPATSPLVVAIQQQQQQQPSTPPLVRGSSSSSSSSNLSISSNSSSSSNLTFSPTNSSGAIPIPQHSPSTPMLSKSNSASSVNMGSSFNSSASSGSINISNNIGKGAGAASAGSNLDGSRDDQRKAQFINDHLFALLREEVDKFVIVKKRRKKTEGVSFMGVVPPTPKDSQHG